MNEKLQMKPFPFENDQSLSQFVVFSQDFKRSPKKAESNKIISNLTKS